MICFTGAWLRARRAASFSVARSPTSAATRNCGRSNVSVFSKRAVFPAPGLDTRLTTKTPASRNRSRSARATISFCLNTFSLTSIMRVFEFNPPPLGRRLAALYLARPHLLECHRRSSRTLVLNAPDAAHHTAGRIPAPALLLLGAAILAMAYPRKPFHRKKVALLLQHLREVPGGRAQP